jgi:hypothetical protein
MEIRKLKCTLNFDTHDILILTPTHVSTDKKVKLKKNVSEDKDSFIDDDDASVKEEEPESDYVEMR